ncbi:MAG: hypothetical protein FWC47_08630 [Oscillospiraceae bacterium]|nr:hypothetical protein [Oscillospiraceae bacterium]
MKDHSVLATIKQDIANHLGQKVTLKANAGRRKIVVNEGILENVYSSIFVVRLVDDNKTAVTYSYSDVLTKTVQLVFV